MTITKFELFNELFSAAGGEVVAEESFQTGKDEFRTELTKIKESGAEAIYIYVDTPELIKIVRQMTELAGWMKTCGYAQISRRYRRTYSLK